MQKNLQYEIDYLGFKLTNPTCNYSSLLKLFHKNKIFVVEENYYKRYQREMVIKPTTYRNDQLTAYFIKKADNLFQVDFRGSDAGRLFDKLNASSFLNSSEFELYRIDICFDQLINNINIQEFFSKCLNYIKQTHPRKRTEWLESTSSTFAINGRNSQCYFRFYTKNNTTLRMEMELKKHSILKKLFLLENAVFFEAIRKLFISRLSALVPLDLELFNWLALEQRKLNSVALQLIPPDKLGFDYLKFDSIIKSPQNLINFIKLLEFSKNLTYETEQFAKLNYRKYEFSLQSFESFYTKDASKTNRTKRGKLIEFFNSVQENSIIQIFSEKEFISLASVPVCKVQKISNRWQVKIYISESLYSYRLPFIIPDMFDYELNKYEFDSRFAVLLAYLQASTTKELDLTRVFENYSKLSNSDKTRMFNYFLKALELLKSNNLIKSKVALVNKTIKEVDLKDVSVKELKETNKLKFYEN